MDSLILVNNPPIAGGDEIRVQTGHGGCIEFTCSTRYYPSYSGPRQGMEEVICRIPFEKRRELGEFILTGKVS